MSTIEEFGRDGKFYFCPYCAYKSESGRSLKRHVNSIHTRSITYICHLCGEVKYRKDHLRRHIARAHEGAPAADHRKLCHRCEMGFSKKEELFAHLTFKHRKRIHPDLLKGLDQDMIHNLNHKQYQDEEEEPEKEKDNKEKEKDHERQYPGLHCVLCHYAGASRPTCLRDHARDAHPLVVQFQCSHCVYSSNDPFNTWKHRIKCRGEMKAAKISCRKCGNSFLHVDHLTQHMQLAHPNTQRIACKQCPDTFYLNASLQAHIVTVHLQQTNYRQVSSKKQWRGQHE